MKTALIVILLVAVGLLAIDEKVQRSKTTESAKAFQDAQDQVGQQAAEITSLHTEVEQLKMQLATKPVQVSVVAGQAPAVPVIQAPLQAQGTLQNATQLVANYSGALVIIEGKNAVGSGFVCNMDGHTFVITNAHVLCDNPGFRITTLKGAVLTAGDSALAVGRDLVKIEVTGADKAFDLVDDINNTVKIGDTVTVLGNAEGAGVVRPMDGRVVGVGPELIEVDATFVKGNSGSPIIQQSTGKVIGVATYITERKIAQGSVSVQSQIRRFGYRLDGISQWQPIAWQAFFAQSSQLADMETLSEDFIKMFGETGGMNFDVNNYSSPVLQRALRQFIQSVREGGRTLSVADKKHLIEGFIGDLRSLTHADILAFNKNAAYDYFRREAEDQGRFRDELYDGLTRALQNNM